MTGLFSPNTYYTVAWVMMALAVVVFMVLLKVVAPYGATFSRKWGPSIPNRLGWVLMEAPAFTAMSLLWILSPRRGDSELCVMTSLYLLHYFQRSFIFPCLLKGRNRMALVVVLMGVLFNLVNTYLIGGWFFYVSPESYYDSAWLHSPLFIIGVVIFFAGMVINLHSDYIIRHLRRPGDTAHYIPQGGMFRYVTSANYFGELTEWAGYALLTWSLGGAIFFIWTFANLAPRARMLHRRYISEFGSAYTSLRRKYIIPYLY